MPAILTNRLRALFALVLAAFALVSANPALAAQDKLQPYLDKAEAIAAKHGMVLGNPNGTLTVYKFFDYNCPYCRASASFMDQMIKQYPQLKLVVIDNPSLGQNSYDTAVEMAQIPAARRAKAHYAAMAPGKRNAAWVQAYAKKLGLSIKPADDTSDKQVAQIRSDIAYNQALSRAIGFRGVPGFIVGRQFFGGFDKAAIGKAICEESGRKDCG